MTVKNKNKYPDYMKSSVSGQFLSKNPIYKDIFMKCVICGKYSLKPVGINQMKDAVKESKNANERRCSLCNYVHVSHLSVLTKPRTELEKMGRILDKKN